MGHVYVKQNIAVFCQIVKKYDAITLTLFGLYVQILRRNT